MNSIPKLFTTYNTLFLQHVVFFTVLKWGCLKFASGYFLSVLSPGRWALCAEGVFALIKFYKQWDAVTKFVFLISPLAIRIMSWQKINCNKFGQVRQKTQVLTPCVEWNLIWAQIQPFPESMNWFRWSTSTAAMKQKTFWGKENANLSCTCLGKQGFLSHSLKRLTHRRRWMTCSHAVKLRPHNKKVCRGVKVIFNPTILCRKPQKIQPARFSAVTWEKPNHLESHFSYLVC